LVSLLKCFRTGTDGETDRQTQTCVHALKNDKTVRFLFIKNLKKSDNEYVYDLK